MTATKSKTPAKKKPAAKKQKAVTFLTRYPDFTLNRVHPEYEYDNAGRKMAAPAPKPEDSPWTVQFEGESYTTKDPVIIEFIREHEEFNRNIWEQGAAPDEPKPTYAEQIQAIVDATATRNLDDLNAVLEEENKTHKRAPVVAAAEAAIEAIEAQPTETGGVDDQTVIAAQNPSVTSDPTATD